MGETIDSFKNHIPHDIRKENIGLDKFLGVLDGMLKVRKDELFTYTRTFLYPLVSDIRTMRRFVDEWGAEYTESSTKLCLDCLYRKYFEIYSSKGTVIGLEKLLSCLFWVDVEPTVTVTDYIMGKPLILFNDNKAYDWLPNAEDLAGELLASAGDEAYVPTLLDDTWLQQRATINIGVDINYIPSLDFVEFIKSVVVLYLPMVSRDFLIININTF